MKLKCLGSGKSTCIQLLQRFYDVTSGTVKLDGIDVRDLNISWLRSQIGIVSQELSLFNDTVFANIALGKEDCCMREVERAAKKAYAHGFIKKLPLV